MNEEDLQVSYSGWARDGMPKKPCCERLLDLAVLERMPKDVIGVFVELPDTELMPGTVFLQDLLPRRWLQAGRRESRGLGGAGCRRVAPAIRSAR